MDKLETLELLKELLDWEALELKVVPKQDEFYDILLPYVMNDVVECYLRFENCRIPGFIDPEQAKIEKYNDFRPVENGDREGVIFRKDNGDMLTVWYSVCNLVQHCYQYHRIGHSWRNQPGQEEIRRLVNLICVLHDKQHFLGDEACNETELELIPLSEFTPFVYWTPINRSIEDWYPESEEGIEAAHAFALEAGDKEYADMIAKYRHSSARKRKRLKEQMANVWVDPKHSQLLSLLQQKTERASLNWPARDYGEAKNQDIAKARQQIEEKYLQEGYRGSYPFFRIANPDGSSTCVDLVEEQPFTVLESEEYSFKIQPIIYVK